MEIALLAAAVILLLLVYFEVESITMQLRDYNDGKTRQHMTNRFPLLRLPRLSEEINRSLKKKEDVLAESLRQETRMKESIAAISHDLRTPLTVMQGYLEMLEKTDCPKTKRRYLEIVKIKTKYLGEAVDSFYDFSLLDSGGFVLKSEVFDLTALLTECMIEHAPAFGQKGLVPALDIPTEAYPVRCDKGAAKRIVDNLLANVLKYGTGEISVRLFKDGGQYTLTIGNRVEQRLAPEMQRIFERFYQGDKGRASEGSGLGLYIVKTLAEAMGLAVHGALQGDFFTITLTIQEGCTNKGSA